MQADRAVTTRKLHLLRFAVWAQSLGYALMAAISTFILTAPSPSKIGAGDFIWPAAAVVGMHLLKLDHRIAPGIPRGLLAALSLSPSIAAIAGTTVILQYIYSTTPVLSPAEVSEQKAWFIFFLAYHIVVAAITLILVWKTFVPGRQEPAPRGS